MLDRPPKGKGGTERILDPSRVISDPDELRKLRSWSSGGDDGEDGGGGEPANKTGEIVSVAKDGEGLDV